MLSPLRPLFAWAFLGYAAIEIFFTFANWFLPRGGSFTGRAHDADFTTIVSIGFPLLAVLIATQLKPALSAARIITVIALIELAAVVLLGAMAFLVGMPHALLRTNAYSLFAYTVFSLAGLAFAALVGFACLRALGLTKFKLPGEAA
jgi:hypothetical protein